MKYIKLLYPTTILPRHVDTNTLKPVAMTKATQAITLLLLKDLSVANPQANVAPSKKSKEVSYYTGSCFESVMSLSYSLVTVYIPSGSIAYAY